MKTINQVRSAFWEFHPQFRHMHRKSWKQNDYPTDIRVSFVDYVDHLRKLGEITAKLANRVTL